MKRVMPGRSELFAARVFTSCDRCRYIEGRLRSWPSETVHSPVSGDQWYCKVVGQEVGPISSDDLFEMFERGQIDRTDDVRQGKTGMWRPFDDAFSERFSGESNVATAVQPTWYFRTLGEEFGPYTIDELKEFIAQGQLSRKDKVREGLIGNWSRAGQELPDLFPRQEQSSTNADNERDLLRGFGDLEDAPPETSPESKAEKPPRKKKRPKTDEDLAAALLGPPVEVPASRPSVRTFTPEPEETPAAPDAAPEAAPQPATASASYTPPAPRYTPPPPPPRSYGSSRSSGGGGGFSLPDIDWSGTPVKVVGGIAVALVCGYFLMNMGFLGSFAAGPVYDSTSVLYADFVKLSENPESPEYEAFYTKFKAEQTELLRKIGNPDPGSTARDVKNAVLTLGSAVEAYHRSDMEKAERESYKAAADEQMAKLKATMGK